MGLRRFLARGAAALRARRNVPLDVPRLSPRDVAIIVLNWNRCEETLACLDSLQQADLDGATVLVVDNGSRDGSVAAVRARFPNVRVLALERNEGYAGGNNAGIRAALEAGARAVLLLNNDARVTREFLPPLLDVLNNNPRAAAVSSAIFRADSPELLDAAWLELYFGHGIVFRRGVNALPGDGFDQVRPVDAGIGCSLLIRGDALARVGLLDEAYFAYHEEVDWCFRARRHGYLIFYQPYSRVDHLGSRSTSALCRPVKVTRVEPRGPQLPNPIPLQWNPVRTYLGARNCVRFVHKNGNLLRRAYYWLSSTYAVPLDLLAILMDRKEDLMLGLWTYRRALGLYCLHCDGVPELAGRTPDPPGSALRRALHAPGRLVWALPRDVRRLHREGRTEELIEHLRGLWDGIRDRPLPLERLGLR